MTDEPPLLKKFLLLLLCVVLVFLISFVAELFLALLFPSTFGAYSFSTIEAPEPPLEQSEMYFRAVSPIKVVNDTTLASIAASIVGDDVFEGIMFPTIIKCLAKYESRMGLLRSGDNGQSRGLLHYYRWWEPGSLWGAMCVGKYGFDDINNDRQQVLCADYLLQEDFNYAYRWTTYALYCSVN